jgi:hypothetical protein
MKQTIFLVKASFSSWDDHHVRTLKAFYNDTDAQAYKSKAERVFTAMSKHIKEAFHKTNPEYREGMSYEELSETMYEHEQTPEYQKALDIWSAHTDFEGFNRCFLQEIEIQ